jgi:hypothetical protein
MKMSLCLSDHPGRAFSYSDFKIGLEAPALARLVAAAPLLENFRSHTVSLDYKKTGVTVKAEDR